MENGKKRKSRLGTKVILGMTFLAVVLILFTSWVVAQLFEDQLTSQYSFIAHSYAHMVADHIDGDRVAGYIETGQKDEYYNEVREIMNVIRKESALRYLYVFIPRENDLIYVWDADTTEGDYDDLGTVEAYAEGDKEAIERTFCKNPVEKLMFTSYSVTEGIAVAYVPIYNSQGDPVALVGADFSTAGIYRVFSSFVKLVSLGILIVLGMFFVFFYLTIRNRVVRPIKDLSLAARQITENLDTEEPYHSDIQTGDEIEELGHSFEQMDCELRDYIKRIRSISSEREKIAAELDVAKRIQESMLPSLFPSFPDREEFEIYATMTPAREVGGDFYDFFLIDHDHLGLVMADVSDKGVPAALYMAVSKSLIKNQIMNMKDHDPAETLGVVNNQLCGDGIEMFVTVWLGVFTISTGELVWANAGHEYPVISKDGEAYTALKSKHGPPMGLFEDVSFRNETGVLDVGEILFLYTDGLPEATDSYGEMLGVDRMLEALNAHRNDAPTDLLVALKRTVDDFVGDREAFDDMTMMALQRKK